MALVYSQQYRPVSTLETGVDSGMSAGQCQRDTYNILNAALYAMNFPLVQDAWIATGGETSVSSPASEYEADKVILFCGRHYLSFQFWKVRWWLQASICEGAGQLVDWSLLVSQDLYYGPEIYNASYLTTPQKSTIRVTTTDWARQTAVLDLSILRQSPADTGYYFFYLLANSGETYARSTISTLTIQPEPVEFSPTIYPP